MQLAKSTGIPVRRLRKLSKKERELRALVNEKKEPAEKRELAERIENTIKELKGLIPKKIDIVHTDREDLEDISTSYWVIEEANQEQTQFLYQDINEAKDEIITIFQHEIDESPPNAFGVKRICKTIIKELENPNFDLKATRIAELARVSNKRVRSFYKELCQKYPNLSTLFSPQRKIERFTSACTGERVRFKPIMKPYSQDIREKIVHALEAQEQSQAEVARRFDVNKSYGLFSL